MRIINADDVEAQRVQEEGAQDVTIRWLINRPDGAPNFAMRLLEVAPGGCTPLHQHAWEHEVYVLAGTLTVTSEDGSRAIGAGDTVLVLPAELHQFRNAGEHGARFLCLVPLT